MDNKVVARLRDGRLIKGTTTNFSPTRALFHVTRPDGDTVEVYLDQLKAVFFVKHLDGNRAYRERKSVEGASGVGRRARCEFLDGEVLTGFVAVYASGGAGIFLTPVDPRSNNERIFVVRGATKSISFSDPTSRDEKPTGRAGKAEAEPAHPRPKASPSKAVTPPPDELFGRPGPKRKR